MFMHLYSDQPCRSGGVKWQYDNRESKCSYTSAVTRHVEVKGVMQQFIKKLSCFGVDYSTDCYLTVKFIMKYLFRSTAAL
jgi:hypothetical protein